MAFDVAGTRPLDHFAVIVTSTYIVDQKSSWCCEIHYQVELNPRRLAFGASVSPWNIVDTKSN